MQDNGGVVIDNITYHYDLAGRLVSESDSSGTILRDYLWLDDIPLAILE